MTYAEAKKAANRRNPNMVYKGDAGNGFSFEVYYNPWLKRQVWTTINDKTGFRII